MVQSSEHIEKIFEQKKDFVIIATTGKVNSKVTDVCKLLTSEKLLPDTATQPADTSGYDMSEIREFKVVYRYLHHNWRPFIEISVTSIMISFLLESDIAELRNQLVIESEGKMTYDLLKDAFEPDIKNRVKKRLEKIQGILKNDTDNERLEEKVEHLFQTIYEEDDIVSGLKKLILDILKI